jgi:hypothetical protein
VRRRQTPRPEYLREYTPAHAAPAKLTTHTEPAKDALSASASSIVLGSSVSATATATTPARVHESVGERGGVHTSGHRGHTHQTTLMAGRGGPPPPCTDRSQLREKPVEEGLVGPAVSGRPAVEVRLLVDAPHDTVVAPLGGCVRACGVCDCARDGFSQKKTARKAHPPHHTQRSWATGAGREGGVSLPVHCAQRRSNGANGVSGVGKVHTHG